MDCDFCGMPEHTGACDPERVRQYDLYLRWYECPVHGETLIRNDVDQPEPVPSMVGVGWEQALHLECGCLVYDGAVV